jgi:hypothetical protein
MKETTEPRRDSKGFTIVISPPKRGNLLSFEGQIALKAQSKRHDKRRNRAKSKRWKKEV